MAPFVARQLSSGATVELQNISRFNGEIWVDLEDGTGTFVINNVTGVDIMLNHIDAGVNIKLGGDNEFSIGLARKETPCIQNVSLAAHNSVGVCRAEFFGMVNNPSMDKMLHYVLPIQYSADGFFLAFTSRYAQTPAVEIQADDVAGQKVKITVTYAEHTTGRPWNSTTTVLVDLNGNNYTCTQRDNVVYF